MALTTLDDVTCTVADSESSNQVELQPILKSVQWEETILDQPGKLTLEYIKQGLEKPFFEGSNVVLAVAGQKVFDGYVFGRDRSQGDSVKVTVYDRLRYLNNSDTFVFEGATPNEIFTQICQSQELPFRIVNGSSFKTAPVAHDNKSLYSMIIRALDEAMIGTGKYLMIRDNAGTLEMVDVATLTTNLLIGDGSLLTGFDFKSSIDSNTYNYVKLVQENKDAGVREVYVAKDSSTIRKWGRLQYFEKVDEDMNEAQIKERADQMLKLYNRKTKTLKVSCLGDLQVRAGSGVGLAIEELVEEGIAKMQMVFASKVTHSISKELHTMDLQLEVV